MIKISYMNFEFILSQKIIFDCDNYSYNVFIFHPKNKLYFLNSSLEINDLLYINFNIHSLNGTIIEYKLNINFENPNFLFISDDKKFLSKKIKKLSILK